MSFDCEKPFNDLPLLPPPIELETKAVLKQAIRDVGRNELRRMAMFGVAPHGIV